MAFLMNLIHKINKYVAGNKVEVTGNKVEYKVGVLPLVSSYCTWYKLQPGIG